MKQAIVIVGMAGVGKTYCGNKYDNVIDFDHLHYHYSYSEEIVKKKNFEQLKGLDEGRKINPEWPENYFSKFFEYIKQYDVVLVPANTEVIEYLDSINFEYILCFPKVDSKSIYMDRYQKRGTNQEWIDRIDKNFEKNIDEFSKKKVKQIVLSDNETLEDKLKEMGMI